MNDSSTGMTSIGPAPRAGASKPTALRGSGLSGWQSWLSSHELPVRGEPQIHTRRDSNSAASKVSPAVAEYPAGRPVGWGASRPRWRRLVARLRRRPIVRAALLPDSEMSRL